MAKVENGDATKGMEAKADDYFFNPFNPDILMLKFKNSIENEIPLKQSYVKLFLPQKATEPFVFKETDDEQFITLLVKLIDTNLTDADFNVKRLAELANRSQTSLYRKVKQITALSIIELIRGVRLRKAACLLERQKHSVQEVSEMVGYNDLPTFRKHFCNLYGMVPSAYTNWSISKLP